MNKLIQKYKKRYGDLGEIYLMLHDSLITENKLYEGLIMSHDIDIVINMINRMFRGNKYINTRPNNTIKYELKTFGATYKLLTNNQFQELIKLLDVVGYFISNMNYIDINNKKTITKFDYIELVELYKNKSIIFLSINIEAKFNTDVYELPKYIYHISLSKYRNKILKNGLIPKSKNKIMDYPDRTFLFLNKEVIPKYLPIFATHLIDDINIFDIYQIKSEELFNIRLLKDPQTPEGIYTLENIHPNKLKLINSITIKK